MLTPKEHVIEPVAAFPSSLTYSGREVGQSNDGRPEFGDIAIGITRMPRFSGQAQFDYRVVHHLIACGRMTSTLIEYSAFEWEDRDAAYAVLDALMHDTDEAITSDVPSPWKCDHLREHGRVLRTRIYAELNTMLDNDLSPRLITPQKDSARERLIHSTDVDIFYAEAALIGPADYSHRLHAASQALNPLAVAAVQSVISEFDVSGTYATPHNLEAAREAWENMVFEQLQTLDQAVG